MRATCLVHVILLDLIKILRNPALN
jgi:hypothetical protein